MDEDNAPNLEVDGVSRRRCAAALAAAMNTADSAIVRMKVAAATIPVSASYVHRSRVSYV